MHFNIALLTAALVTIGMAAPASNSAREANALVARASGGCSPGGEGAAAGCPDADNSYCSCAYYDPCTIVGCTGFTTYACSSTAYCPTSDKIKRDIGALEEMQKRENERLAGVVRAEEEIRSVQAKRK